MTDDRSPWAAVAFGAVVLLGTALRLWLALGPLEHIDGVMLPDDAYLFLDLARSIAHGEGPVYGREPTNGFQPLFAFLLAPIFWFADGGRGPVHAALVLSTLVDAATVTALGAVLRRGFGVAPHALVVLAAAWATSPGVIHNVLNGMESSVAVLGLVVAWAAHLPLLRGDGSGFGHARAFGAGAAVGLAMLARVDAVLLVPALAAVALVRAARGRLTLRSPVALLACWALGAALAFAPWLVYSGVYTGDFYPISGRAVRFQALVHFELYPLPEGESFHWVHFRRAAGEIVRGNLVALAGLGLLVVTAPFVFGLQGARRILARAAGPLAPWLCHALVLFLAYTLWIHGTWFFRRYLYPVSIPCLLGLALTADVWIRALARRREVLTAVLAGALLVANALTPRFREITAAHDGSDGYARLGEWVRDRFPPGTVLGAKQSGAIGYFADRCTVINLDGVVNRGAFQALQEGRALDYIAEQGIEYLMVWRDVRETWTYDPDARFFRHLTREPDRFALVPLEEVPGVRSWGTPFWVYRLERRT